MTQCGLIRWCGFACYWYDIQFSLFMYILTLMFMDLSIYGSPVIKGGCLAGAWYGKLDVFLFIKWVFFLFIFYFCSWVLASCFKCLKDRFIIPKFVNKNNVFILYNCWLKKKKKNGFLILFSQTHLITKCQGPTCRYPKHQLFSLQFNTKCRTLLTYNIYSSRLYLCTHFVVMWKAFLHIWLFLMPGEFPPCGLMWVLVWVKCFTHSCINAYCIINGFCEISVSTQ